MTKAGAYEKAWRLGFKRDFSLADEIYHPDYKTYDYRTGIEANIEDDKVIVSSRNQTTTIGPFKTIFENENFVCIECFIRRHYDELCESNPDYMARMTAIHYKNNKIIEQKTNAQLLDFDPSEGQDWSWEDYE